MDIEEIKKTIAADSSLDEPFLKWAQESGTDANNLSIREGFRAWEWCLQRLLEKGLTEQHAMAMRSMYMGKQQRLGTYGAIQECLFGTTPTLIFG